MWHTLVDCVVSFAESAWRWLYLGTCLLGWSRRIKRLFQSSAVTVLCRVEIDSRRSLKKADSIHEFVGIPGESVDDLIFFVRSQKVILDRTLASLYRVSTREVIQAVRRKPERFPPDFMFQLTMEEAKALEGMHSRSQLVTKKARGKQTRRGRPYVFTEQGVLMLSSVLRRDRAIQVNIQLTRTFVRLREMFASNAEITD